MTQAVRTPQLLTSEDAAARFHMKPQAFRDLARKHSIPTVAAGRRILFTEAALVQLQDILTKSAKGKSMGAAWLKTQQESRTELAAAWAALDAADKRRNRPGFIYFASFEGSDLVKIGFAVNVETRLATLQTGAPEKLKALKVLAGGERDERRFHGIFQQYRHRGEWFRIEGELRDFLEQS